MATSKHFCSDCSTQISRFAKSRCRICSNKAKANGVTINCNYCGKSFYRIPSRDQSEHRFCSQPCHYKWKTKQPRRVPITFSRKRLKQLLYYDAKTGRFTWRVSGRGRFMRAGTRAGTLTNGHRSICIDQTTYLAGPLAVFYMRGCWPKRMVDHINGNGEDDRWRNLREANHSQNGGNSRARKNKMYSSLKGVTWNKGRFQATIKVNYRSINLGRFDTAKRAHRAYMAAARKYFGEFARAR